MYQSSPKIPIEKGVLLHALASYSLQIWYLKFLLQIIDRLWDCLLYNTLNCDKIWYRRQNAAYEEHFFSVNYGCLWIFLTFCTWVIDLSSSINRTWKKMNAICLLWQSGSYFCWDSILCKNLGSYARSESEGQTTLIIFLI